MAGWNGAAEPRVALITGAGGAMRHIDPDVFAVNVEVNLSGTFRTIHACLPRGCEPCTGRLRGLIGKLRSRRN